MARPARHVPHTAHRGSLSGAGDRHEHCHAGFAPGLARGAVALRRIGSEGGQVSLLVNVSSDEVSSFQVTPEVSRVLSELGIAVEFEFARE